MAPTTLVPVTPRAAKIAGAWPLGFNLVPRLVITSLGNVLARPMSQEGPVMRVRQIIIIYRPTTLMAASPVTVTSLEPTPVPTPVTVTVASVTVRRKWKVRKSVFIKEIDLI